MGLAQVKILSLERDSTREPPEFHPRSRLSEISSCLSENGPESTSFFFHFIFLWARIVSPEQVMQKKSS